MQHVSIKFETFQELIANYIFIGEFCDEKAISEEKRDFDAP